MSSKMATAEFFGPLDRFVRGVLMLERSMTPVAEITERGVSPNCRNNHPLETWSLGHDPQAYFAKNVPQDHRPGAAAGRSRIRQRPDELRAPAKKRRRFRRGSQRQVRMAG